MRPPDHSASLWLRDHSARIVSAGIILALLYLGRSVLIPVTLALVLSLLVAPLVRVLTRMGVARTAAVLVVVFGLVVACTAVTVVLGTQVLRTAESLPQYQATVHQKLRVLNDVTLRRLQLLTRETNRLIEMPDSRVPGAGDGHSAERSAPPAARGVPAADLREVQHPPLQLFGRLVKSVWGPIEATGIVLIVLIFALLEHESLRDRFIRLAGAADIRAATLALNDAGERLSRFFVSQFAVNLTFGVAICLSMTLLHVPQSMLLGTLAGVLRFVPYVGTALAALIATTLAFAIDPGWSLAVCTLGVFILLDVIAAQLLEPHLYGHATGLSPLSVVVGAIFWSALWGPAGLILSTPLTLCLLVAGRHMKTLESLELLLGNVQPLTLPQKFYQRALSGDPHEILANARTFLKRDSLAAYCDRVLIPALHLASLDAAIDATSEAQHRKVRRVVADVVTTLSGSPLPRRRHRGSVLEEVDPGRWLRQQREQLSGRWQGPIGVPPGSIVLCLGLGSPADDLAAELLVRLLRGRTIDARHFSPADIGVGLPPGADPGAVAIVFLMSAFPGPERDRAARLSEQIRALLPRASLVRVFCPGVTGSTGLPGRLNEVDQPATSLVQAIEMCKVWHTGPESAHLSPPSTRSQARGIAQRLLLAKVKSMQSDKLECQRSATLVARSGVKP